MQLKSAADCGIAMLIWAVVFLLVWLVMPVVH